MTGRAVQLGIGLIRIGREWGHVKQAIPTEEAAFTFLEHAVESGIRYFDTAPSYGYSEERFGKFLRSLPASVRDELTIATKFGEHWDTAKWESSIDHSFDALRRSLDQSLERLGRVDVLQLHKTTPEVLRGDDLAQAWDYARSLGITRLGPSVSDLESAEAAVKDQQYWCIQLPLNKIYDRFALIADAAGERGIFVAANRPFAMGAMVEGAGPRAKVAAFEYLLARQFGGVILTGTASIPHLDENISAFRQAQAATI